MPTIDYELTLLLQSLDDGSTLGEALYFPETSALAGRRGAAREELLRVARRELEELPLAELARRSRPGVPELAQLDLTLDPPARSAEWLTPVRLALPYARWVRPDGTAVASVPALGIQVLARSLEHLPELLRRDVRLALSRRGAAGSLGRLAEVARSRALAVQPVTITATVKTPREVARDEDQDREPVLPRVATDLTALDLKHAHEVEAVVERLAEHLTGARRRSVLLVGASGTGKTALVAELVRRRAALGLAHTPFWATTGARLVAGTCGFGLWQQRCTHMIHELARARGVLHAGNLMELAEVGRSDRNTQGIASFLAPYLARGELTALAECTPEQLAALERGDPHLAQVWTVFPVAEPDPRACRVILERWLARAARHGRAAVSARGVDLVTRLHRRYATYSAWPGRPLRFLDGLLGERPRGEQLDEHAVVDAFSRETGLPRAILDDACVMDVDAVERWFAGRVIGQPAAVTLVTQLLATVKARLTRPRRPIASLLFIGPTGVGKTETARALATYLFGDASRMTRFDMSEYGDPVSAQRLVGTAARAEGLLTARVREQPFSVVLLDEFEKADPSLFDLLLQVLGDGRLTDAAGRVADFSSAVVILTSNLGAESFQRTPAGFATGADAARRAEAHFVEAVRAAVRPELFNRIDRVVPFLPLSRAVMDRLVRRELDLALARDGLRFRRAALAVEPAAVELLAARGHDPRFGARPLKRAIEREVLAPLAAALVRHPEGEPVQVSVGAGGGRVVVEVRSAAVRGAVPDGSSAAPWVELRRMAQRLELGRAATRLANEAYVLGRAAQLDAKRRPTPRWDAARARRLAKLRRVEAAIRHLSARLVSLEEAALLVAYEEPPPGASAPTSPEAMRREMRAAMVQLRALTHASPDRVSLLVTGDHPAIKFTLARAYADVAATLGYRLELIAVRTGRAAPECAAVEKPAAFLDAGDESALALVLTVSGPAAGLRFESEAGVHRFRERAGDEIGIEVRRVELPFRPPEGVERKGQVPSSGPRRRLYDRVRGVIEDARTGTRVPWSSSALAHLTELALDRGLAELLER